MVTFTRTKSRLRSAFILLLLLLSVASFGQKVTTPPPLPGIGGTRAGFEVDADFKAGFIPTFWVPNTVNYEPDYLPNYTPSNRPTAQDWTTVLKYVSGNFAPVTAGDKRSVGHIDGNWGNQSQNTEQWSFAGNSNKNSDLIGTGQSPYLLQQGGSGPQKNDITNTFLHTREDPTMATNPHTWLFYAAETRATNGASFLDFEYNQAGVKILNSKLVGLGPVGGRTPGDFILVVNFVDGGTNPIVGVRIWQANGTWTEELPASRLQAFITVNTGNVDALSVSGKSSYTDNGAPSGTCKALQLVEGGIDMTILKDLIDEEFSELNLCTTTATVTIKTRSSPSFTAELKDLDVVPFSIIPGPPGVDQELDACPDEIGGTTATFNLTSVEDDMADGQQNVTVAWFENYNSETKEFSNPISDPANYVSGSKTVHARLTNEATCISHAQCTLSVGSSPTGTNESMEACPDNIGGSTATFNLTDRADEILAGTTGVTIEGYYTGYDAATDVFSGKIADPTKHASLDNKTVYAKLQSGTCFGVAEIALTVHTSPARPAVGYTPPACDESKFKINVLCPTGNDIWYKLNGGNPTQSTEFTNIAAGAGFSVTLIDANGCESAPTDCTNYADYECATTTTKAVPATKEEQQPAQTQATKADRIQDINARILGKANVLAAPNPFTDKVRFTLQSDVTGQGSLEIYNTVGQKVATVFQGRVEAGKVFTKEYLVPVNHRQNLIYIFRVGDQKTSGKLLNW